MPSAFTLLRAWGLMMALTGLSLWAAISDQSIASTLAAMGAGVLKAVLILWAYLNLRRSPSGWKAVFGVFLIAIALIVLGAFWVGKIVK
ncbi:MAG: cytochrome C oxidase subunit IV family protein [Phaeospirillum sp.]|nr:cytochrome C oxidase subunit IV family protein [Phaeospirillum sp.]